MIIERSSEWKEGFTERLENRGTMGKLDIIQYEL